MSEPGFCEDGSLCVCEKPSRHIVTLIETDKGRSMGKSGDKVAKVKNKSVTGSVEYTSDKKYDGVHKSFSLAEQVNIVKSCAKGPESKKKIKNKGVSGSLESNLGQKCKEEIPLATRDLQKNFVHSEQVSVVRSRSKSRESKKRKTLVQVNAECNTQKQILDDENSGSVKSNCSVQNLAFNCYNKQETDIKTMDTATILSTPKNSNCRKRRITKKKRTNVKKQRSKSHENLLKGPEWEEMGLDPLNLSLPTPKNTSPAIDSEKSKSVTDLDEDLPERLTPNGYTNTLHERDIVWVKWRKGLFLPAIVKNVYKKKNRVTLILFQPEDKPLSQFTMSMGRTVFSYFDPRKTDIMADSRHLPKEDFTFFNACVERVDEYLQKMALKQLKEDWSFFQSDGDLVEKCEDKISLVTQCEKIDMSLQEQIDSSMSLSESRKNKPEDEIVQVKSKDITGSLECNLGQMSEDEIPLITQYVKTDSNLQEQTDCSSESFFEREESKTGDKNAKAKNKSVIGSFDCNSDKKCEETSPVSQDVRKSLSLAEQVNIVRSHSKSRVSKKRKRLVQINTERNTQKQELGDENGNLVKSNCSVQNCAFNSSSKQENDLETMDTATISSTPKVSNHRKRRITKEKRTNVKKQRSKSYENLLKGPVWEETGPDPLNSSLPTPKNASPAMDSEESNSVSDSDEDLPDGLTPQAYTNTLHERDLVWVKWRKGLFLPAIVKFVYKKKKRVTLVLFQPEDEPISQFTMNMGRSIFSYFDPRKADIMDNSRYLPKEDFALFNACVQRLDEFLQKTALKQLDNDWSFFKEEGLVEEVDKAKEESEGEEKEQHPESDSRGFNTDIETEIEPVKKSRGLSKKGLLRKEKLKEKTKDLTNFLLSGECKGHLSKIFKGEVKSEAHDIFVRGTTRERLYLKHRGFGPIDDDDQVESIVLTFHSWLKEVNQNQYLNANSYVFDVWVPEAVVFGLKKLHRYSTKRAWEMFNKGVKSTKEELQLVHEGLIRKSPEVNNTQEEKFKLFKPPKRLILKS